MLDDWYSSDDGREFGPFAFGLVLFIVACAAFGLGYYVGLGA